MHCQYQIHIIRTLQLERRLLKLCFWIALQRRAWKSHPTNVTPSQTVLMAAQSVQTVKYLGTLAAYDLERFDFRLIDSARRVEALHLSIISSSADPVRLSGFLLAGHCLL